MPSIKKATSLFFGAIKEAPVTLLILTVAAAGLIAHEIKDYKQLRKDSGIDDNSYLAENFSKGVSIYYGLDNPTYFEEKAAVGTTSSMIMEGLSPAEANIAALLLADQRYDESTFGDNDDWLSWRRKVIAKPLQNDLNELALNSISENLGNLSTRQVMQVAGIVQQDSLGDTRNKEKLINLVSSAIDLDALAEQGVSLEDIIKLKSLVPEDPTEAIEVH